MQLEILREDHHASASNEDKVLVERTRKAVSGINLRFRDNCPGIGMWEQFVVAVVYFNPLRLDFKACTPGENAEAFFFNPQAKVTPALFEGDELAREIRERLESDLAGYRERICQPDN